MTNAEAEPLFRDPLIGTRVGSFEILSAIASGGQGTIYRARHVEMGRGAAVKVLHAGMSADETSIARFQVEARAVNAIGHVNLVDVFDIGRLDDGRVYLVMELLLGETLEERLGAGPMEPQLALHIVREVGEALAEAHRKGFVHRDVKPENIFLLPSVDGPPRVKVLDFGIAKLASGEGGEKLTQTGAIIGTPAYMSPEQIEGTEIDGRSDVYALGVVLYEMLAGQPPFQGGTVAKVLRMHLTTNPRLIHEVTTQDVPSGLSGVIARAMWKDRVHRYASMDALLAALDSAGRGAEPEAEFLESWHGKTQAVTTDQVDLSRTADAPPLPARIASQRSVVPIVIAGVAVAAAVVVAWAMWPRSEATIAVTATAAPVDTPATATPAPPPDLVTLRESALTRLSSAASTGDEAVRARALRKLGSAGEPTAETAARAALADPSPRVKAAGAHALGRLGIRDSGDEIHAIATGPDAMAALWAADALLQLGDTRGRSVLLASLKSGDVRVRLRAALLLAEHGDADAAPTLRALLAEVASDDPAITLPALAALARLGDDEAIEALQALLKSGTPATQVAAAEVLAGVGDSKGRDLLAEVVRSPGATNRAQAARALSLLGDPAAAVVLTEIAGAADDADRGMALETLGELGDTASLPLLATALESKAEQVWLPAAVGILMMAGASPAARRRESVRWTATALELDDWESRSEATTVIAELDPALAVPLLGNASLDEDARVRRRAARGLGRTRAPEAVPALRLALTDDDDAVRLAAAEALADIESTEATETLREISDDATDVGILASAALAARGDGEALTALEAAASSKDPDVRRLAIEAAAAKGGESTRAVLTLAKGDLATRFRAASALALLGDDSGEAVLREGLSDSALNAEAYVALRSLGLEVEAGGGGLLGMLDDDDPSVRIDAVAASRSLPPAEAFSVIRRALTDPSEAVRRVGLESLERFADAGEAAIALYQLASRDSDPVVANAAQAALSRLQAPPMSAEDALALLDELGIVVQPIPEVTLAEPEPPAERKPRERAEDHIARGATLLRTGRYPEAIKEFKRADKLEVYSETAFHLGDAFRLWALRASEPDSRVDRLKKSERHYRRYLTLEADGARAGRVRAYLEEIDVMATEAGE